MARIPEEIFRAIRQARKAIHRGDIDQAFKWTFIADRQTEIAARLVGIDDENRRLRRLRKAAFAKARAALTPASP